MSIKLVSAVKVNQVFAHLNESENNLALYSAFARGEGI